MPAPPVPVPSGPRSPARNPGSGRGIRVGPGTDSATTGDTTASRARPSARVPGRRIHYWFELLIPELRGHGITVGVLQGQVMRQLLHGELRHIR